MDYLWTKIAANARHSDKGVVLHVEEE